MQVQSILERLSWLERINVSTRQHFHENFSFRPVRWATSLASDCSASMRIVAIADYERERTACPPVCGRHRVLLSAPRRNKFCPPRYLCEVDDGEVPVGPSPAGVTPPSAPPR